MNSNSCKRSLCILGFISLSERVWSLLSYIYFRKKTAISKISSTLREVLENKIGTTRSMREVRSDYSHGRSDVKSFEKTSKQRQDIFFLFSLLTELRTLLFYAEVGLNNFKNSFVINFQGRGRFCVNGKTTLLKSIYFFGDTP